MMCFYLNVQFQSQRVNLGTTCGEWSTLLPDPVPIVQEAGWTQGRYGRVRKTSPLPGFDPGIVQPVASRYTD